jgi:hypothetical protein
MAADVILIVAGIASSWITCSIIGGERQRLVQNVEAAKKDASAAAPAPETTPPAKKRPNPPAGKKPAG